MPNTSLPLVSIMLLSYNQENLISEAVESLFSQTYSPLEIILSDDASPDNTFIIMEQLVEQYNGPHIIKLNQNNSNIGIVEHLKIAQGLTQGELIVATAGDDISLPNRCEKIATTWLEQDKKVDLIVTDAFDMSFDGEILEVKKTDKLEEWHNINDWFARPPFVLGASHAWSRNLVNRYGEISPKIRGEDHVMIFRAMLTGSAITISEPLVKHRQGGVSKKTKYSNVYEKREQMMLGIEGSIEFTNQCILDAKVIGLEDMVKAGFKSKIEHDSVIQDILDTDSVIGKMKIIFKAKQVGFSKKIRFLIYDAFPWIMSPFFFIKAKLG